MHSKFMLLFLILLSFVAESKETILFIDTNNNQLEIKTAQETAKKLNKTLVVYPSRNESYDELKAQSLIETTKFETLMISGHNRGGFISGDQDAGNKSGQISYYDVAEFLGKNPYSKENTSTLLLLGCFTGNHEQMVNWKVLFPNVRLIAGYDGKAPRGTTALGHDYIREILTKKEKIYQAADGAKIERELRNLKSIYELDASIYVDGRNCAGKDKEYIFRPLRAKDERFKTFDISECAQKRAEYHSIAELYMKYKDGIIDYNNPNTSRDLLKVDSFMNKNSHCFEGVDVIDVDETLYMRFWPEVRGNITKHFKSDLEPFFEDISKLSTDHNYLKEKIKERIKDVEEDKNKYGQFLKTVDGKRILDKEKLAKDIESKLKVSQAALKKEEDIFDQKLQSLLGGTRVPQSQLNMLKQSMAAGFIGPDMIFTADNFSFAGFADSTAGIMANLASDFYKSKDSTKITANYLKTKMKHLRNQFTKDELKVSHLGIQESFIESEQILVKEIVRLENELKKSPKSFEKMFSSLPVKSLDEANKMSRKQANDMAHNLNESNKLLYLLPAKDQETFRKTSNVFNDFYYGLNGQQIPFSWHEASNDVEKPNESQIMEAFSFSYIDSSINLPDEVYEL